LIVELALRALEFADHGPVEDSVAAVDPIEAPLARLWVVETQACSLDVACGTAHIELQQIGPAVPDFSDNGNPVVFGPGLGAGQRTQEPRDVGLPGANREIEIPRSVPTLVRTVDLCGGPRVRRHRCNINGQDQRHQNRSSKTAASHLHESSVYARYRV